MTYQLKIQLRDIYNPEVWRHIQVPAQFTMYRLHKVIQVAFGWKNSHLFQFSPEGWASYPQISSPYPDIQDDVTDASKVKLRDILTEEGQIYMYIYDFGDNWLHVITVEKIIAEKTQKALCIGGEAHCPPEDCGGFTGYQDLKKIVIDPTHPEYIEMKEWLGLRRNQKWDPMAFDLKKAAAAVQRI